MATSKINFLASHFSYAPTVTKSNAMDAITKFLVSGFGPWTIEQLIVTNKVARVVTTEKNFKSIAGCKLAIGGTGVAALDDSHEIKTVYKDGFDFDIDTPNATFTNGLTYSVPSLGWSLVRQTGTISIFRSDTTTNPFFLIISIKRGRPSTDIDDIYTYHNVQICYKLDERMEPVNPWPHENSAYYQFLPIHPRTEKSNSADWNSPCHFYFYGDSSYFLMGADCGTSINYTLAAIKDGNPNAVPAVAAMGEVKSTIIGESFTFVCGPKIAVSRFSASADLIGWTGYGTGPAIVGFIGATTSNFDDAYYGFKVSDTESFHYRGGVSFPKRIYTYYSGKPKGIEDYTYNFTEFLMLPMELFSSGGSRMSVIPGVYSIDNRPFNIDSLPMKPFKVLVNGKLRNGVFVKGNSTNSNNAGGAVASPENTGVAWLDLTGPIR